MTKEDLIAFEAEVVAAYNRGEIRAPVHLSSGNEDQLLCVFRHFRPGDWVIGTWRSHFHCLCAGVPTDELMAAIRAGRSISLCFPEHRVLCSGIVAGAVPIAVGIAMGIKRRAAISSFGRATERVWCFVGDMAARSGALYEARQYAVGHDLPITFVIEDNGKSVLTDTEEAWGPGAWWEEHRGFHSGREGDVYFYDSEKFAYYRYELAWPHQGTGTKVQFSF